MFGQRVISSAVVDLDSNPKNLLGVGEAGGRLRAGASRARRPAGTRVPQTSEKGEKEDEAGEDGVRSADLGMRKLFLSPWRGVYR